MFNDSKKFNTEIESLRRLSAPNGLHPLQKQQVKQRVMAAIAKAKISPAPSVDWLEKHHRLIRYIAVTLLGLSAVGGTAFASGNAKPGDFLFPVKKATEHVRLQLAPTDQAKAELQTKFAKERLKELSEIKAEIKANARASATSSPANLQARTEAEEQAKAEVSTALKNLQEVKTNLETKGNTTAAQAVGDTIVKLQTKIQEDTDDKKNGNDSKAEEPLDMDGGRERQKREGAKQDQMNAPDNVSLELQTEQSQSPDSGRESKNNSKDFHPNQ